jgi:hypothetical protein
LLSSLYDVEQLLEVVLEVGIGGPAFSFAGAPRFFSPLSTLRCALL